MSIMPTYNPSPQNPLATSLWHLISWRGGHIYGSSPRLIAACSLTLMPPRVLLPQREGMYMGLTSYADCIKSNPKTKNQPRLASGLLDAK
ncbi:unnamed protein product [Periconia digitata]|uniref:Uncharacterized protein n=1 Tax=Periconia digitata TaxID=1303443 RepID=A0A9W4U8N2_9PLEO|nr:unnamed protein product [Periconia digitata]